jgi:hypothetical protein
MIALFGAYGGAFDRIEEITRRIRPSGVERSFQYATPDVPHPMYALKKLFKKGPTLS